jgi:hypothetical protein
MAERDDQLAEGFLVDGVAPSVIGGDASPEPVGGVGGPGGGQDVQPATRREPPTTPIPAQAGPAAHGAPGAQQPADQRKGWIGRMFGRP